MDPGRVGLRSLIVVIVAVILTSAVPIFGLGRAEAASPSCPRAPSGHISVGVAVDDDGSGITVRCVTVVEGSSGFDALTSAGHQLRIEGGFLCAIDGVPSEGCATASFDGYYWRYFHASPGGTWNYSTAGAGYRLPHKNRCAIEGWRWSDSKQARTLPRVSVPQMNCVSPGHPATPAPPTTAAPVVTPPPPAGAAPAAPIAPISPATPGAHGNPGLGGSSVGPSGETGSPVSPSGDDALQTPAELGDGSQTTTSLPTTTTAKAGDTGAETEGPIAADQDRHVEVGSPVDKSKSEPSGSSSVGGLIAALAIVALIGGLGVAQARRRHRSGSTG